MSVINENSIVEVHYKGKFDDGNVFDSSRAVEGTDFQERGPLKVELGKGMIIPGFEKALQGMSEGESKTITIPAAEAYGEVVPERIIEVEKAAVPSDVVVGAELATQSPQGPIRVVVKEVKEDTVVLDGNHPFAGKDLTFELEVMSIS